MFIIPWICGIYIKLNKSYIKYNLYLINLVYLQKNMTYPVNINECIINTIVEFT